MSLRLRLLVAAGLIAMVALVAADVATYSSLRSFLFSRVDQTLLGLGPIGPASAPPGGPARPPGSLDRQAPGIFVERVTATGHVEFQVPASEPGGKTYTPVLPGDALSGRPGTGPRFFTTAAAQAGGPDFRVLVLTTADGDHVVLGQLLDATTATLHRLVLIELAVTGAALAAAVLLGFWLVHVGLRPLRQVEDTAEAIAAGDLDRRVPGADRRTELGRLARVLNGMLSRIQEAFAARDATEARLRSSEEQLRRFVADASHELRTPLAAVSAYAELYGRGAAERPEDLARVMAGIRAESARMQRLVEDLLLLARLDEGVALQPEPVELVSLVADAVHAAQAVGPDWPLALEAGEPVEVVADPVRIRQVVDNLLANVRAHTPRGTPAVVRLWREDGTVVLQVADQGPGIDDADATRVFGRFFRSDPSRARERGGAGLGLAIVAAIVSAHGGTVSAANALGGGAVLTVRLPAEAPGPDAEEAAAPPREAVVPGPAGRGGARRGHAPLAPPGPVPRG